MNSNLKKMYGKMNYSELLGTRTYQLSSNPFYKVNNFIANIEKGLNKNYLGNLIDLIIMQENQTEYTSDYDYKNNKVYSKDSKSDIFGLLHVASNDREKEYTGIITKDGIGYGLNNGITEYYTNQINGKKFVYPIEALSANVLDAVQHRILALSYFKNNSEILERANSEAITLMKTLDTYHDNYLELTNLYKQKDDKERFYHNQIYGNSFENKDVELRRINGRIYKLECINYGIVFDIYGLLISIIRRSALNKNEQSILIEYVNKTFNNLFKKDNFNYLNNLTKTFEVPEKRRILTK